MGSFETKVKFRANEVKHQLKRGVKILSNSLKKGWAKVKHLKR